MSSSFSNTDNISSISTSSITLGSKTSANSLPVVIASDDMVNTVSAQAARVTGTITANGQSVTAPVSAYSVATVTVTGTYTGLTFAPEASDDNGVTYYPVLASDSSSTASAATSISPGTNATKMYNVTLPGVTNFRVRATAFTSGTASVGITATADPMVFNVAAGIVGIPTIQGNSASLASDSGLPVKTGGVFNTTQPTATTGQRIDTQSTARGAVIVATGVDAFSSRVTDGTNTAAVKAASTAAGATDPALVVAVSPNNSIAVTQATAASLNAAVVGTKTNNSVAPSTTNLGTLPAVANAALQAVTEGNQVSLSTPLNQALRIDHASVAGTTVVNGGLAGSISIGGPNAQNVAITQNPVLIGGSGVSSEPTVVTTGRLAAFITDLYGKLITSPYAGRDNFVKGTATTTGTSDTSVVAAAGANLKNYITGIYVFNTGATTASITIKDGSGGATLLQSGAPTGGGSNIPLPVPIVGSANTAVYFAAGSSSTTISITMVGYKGA